jgi:hypothetical protein
MNSTLFPLPCPPDCGLPGLGTHIAKGVAASAATSIMTAMSAWVVGGASWLVGHVIGLVTPETKVSLTAAWFTARLQAMVEVAALLVAPLVAAASIGAVIRQDGRRLVRIFGVGLPVAILGTVTAVALTELALGLVDALCALITPPDAYAPFLALGRAVGEQQIPMFVQFIVASVVVLATVLLWMEMVLRATVIYIAVFFLPLGLAAFVWPATAHITKRFIEILAAVIGSKFVIVATLTLGGAVVAQKHAGVDAALTGTAILLLAAFAPFSVLRLVPVFEAAATAHLEGMTRRPARAAMATAGAMSSGARAAGMLSQLGGGGGSGGGGGGGGVQARGVGPVAINEHLGSWPVPPDAAESGSGGQSSPARDPGQAATMVAGVGSDPGGPARAGPGSGGGSGGAPLVPTPALPPAIRPGSGRDDPDGWSDDV